LKGFRSYSWDFLSDFKAFRYFTWDFKVFKPDFRDSWSEFTDYRDFKDCRDLRLDIWDFRSDFRSFAHGISEVVGPLGANVLRN